MHKHIRVLTYKCLKKMSPATMQTKIYLECSNLHTHHTHDSTPAHTWQCASQARSKLSRRRSSRHKKILPRRNQRRDAGQQTCGWYKECCFTISTPDTPDTHGFGFFSDEGSEPPRKASGKCSGLFLCAFEMVIADVFYGACNCTCTYAYIHRMLDL